MKNGWTEEIERLRAVNKELEEACKIALSFLQEYRERVIKGRIEGELLPGDYTITRMLSAALEKAVTL